MQVQQKQMVHTTQHGCDQTYRLRIREDKMILDEKSSEMFYNEINDGEISKKQQRFLDECSQLLERGFKE